jgi:HAD superfamily hydrolase (TIGR01509 family)
LDGTLADTERFHFEAWRDICRERGRDLSDEQFKKTFGLANADILRTLFQKDPDESEVAHWGDRKERRFRELALGRVRPMPGATVLVAHLATLGVPQAIASSAPPENISFLLDALGIASSFRATVTRAEVARGKPFPDIFLRAGAKLGFGPEACAVIEDAPAGVEAANAAKMRSVGLVGAHAASDLEAADLVVDDLSTLCWPRDEWERFVLQRA